MIRQLPELSTSVMAGFKGERDIAVGNVIGSNIFNILAILGICGAITPGGLTIQDSTLFFHIPVMIAVSTLCLPLCFTGRRISRMEGLILTGFYGLYLVFLVLSATHPAPILDLKNAFYFFIMPMAAIAVSGMMVSFVRRSELSDR